MSGYGWLTQSALMPKKSKLIKAQDQSSLFGLKAVISREKEKIQAGEKQKRKIYEIKHPKKNTGVEERAKNDQKEKVGTKLHDGSKMLQIKEKMYESLESQKRNVGKLLVDFTAKILHEDNDNEYQKVREQFYSGKLKEVQQQKEQIQVNQIGGQDLHERLAWERQILGKLRGQEDQREKVKQVFDRRMHGDQKNALEAVLKEFSEEQKKLEEAKQRREEFQNQRIRKLKKLNILSNEKAQEKNQKEQ